MAFVPLIIMAAAAVGGAVYSGMQQKQQYEFQAQQQENEAKMSASNALLANRDAQLEQEQIAQERRKALATGLVAAGSSGIMLNGSFADSQFDTALSYERARTMAQYRGDIQGYNYRNQSGSLIASAGMSRIAGRNAMTNGFISAVGKGASAFGSYYGGKG